MTFSFMTGLFANGILIPGIIIAFKIDYISSRWNIEPTSGTHERKPTASATQEIASKCVLMMIFKCHQRLGLLNGSEFHSFCVGVHVFYDLCFVR